MKNRAEGEITEDWHLVHEEREVKAVQLCWELGVGLHSD